MKWGLNFACWAQRYFHLAAHFQGIRAEEILTIHFNYNLWELRAQVREFEPTFQTLEMMFINSFRTKRSWNIPQVSTYGTQTNTECFKHKSAWKIKTLISSIARQLNAQLLALCWMSHGVPQPCATPQAVAIAPQPKPSRRDGPCWRCHQVLIQWHW